MFGTNNNNNSTSQYLELVAGARVTMFDNFSYDLNFVTCVPEAARLGGIGAITAQTSAVLAHGITIT